MDFEILQTGRLYLRKLTGDQWQEILERSSDLEVIDFLGVAREDLAKERKKTEKGFETHNKSLLIFQLVDKQSGQIIGWCGYHTWYLDHARAEIGYGLFDDAFKRKGLMTEAMRAVIDYGFDAMQLNRIEAFVGTQNTASLQTLAKFGFVREGLLKSHYFKNGVYEDSLVFGLLRN
ncbi:GNAT family N-acetyltransferase [Flavobacterium caeni]|uniref:Ribosomal-protein-alanine N-acetyltransferase n=1 Tax=Flavobacterium caeni TaxID=490189 RepID=A0A1G5GKR6_9FLAO|nr:GNAT family protein [Flavobacterium caeni]SCY52135.1 ribosomal-protein-alanine N-acetyltransferase [Flavobacterium caeni]